MAEMHWKPTLVEERFAEAADVMKRLPGVRVPGYFNTWPKMVVEFADRVGQEPQPMRLPPPSPAAISRMEESLGWLRWLETIDAKISSEIPLPIPRWVISSPIHISITQPVVRQITIKKM